MLKEKEEEKADLETLSNIYEHHAIDGLDYSKLKHLEEKIFRSLEIIRTRKQKCKNFFY
jgi:hypothetical protein